MNEFETHKSVLEWAVNNSEGPVVEFGCGFGSTPLLHHLCSQQKRTLISIESDQSWFNDMANEFSQAGHAFINIVDWFHFLDTFPFQQTNFGVIFVDQSPWEARKATIELLKYNAEYIVLHDCDYFPREGLLGKQISPLNGPHDRGERNYDDVFKYWYEYFPPEPWPAPTGPPTLIGSMYHHINYE